MTAVILGMLAIAAGRLVAMRVEVEGLRPLGEDTVVALTVQIAPEDRPLIGGRAWLTAELKQGETTADRIARAVDVDPEGIVQLELAWPPGFYDLRVDIEGGSHDSAGFWRGRVNVPRIESTMTPAVDEPAGAGHADEEPPAPVAAPTTVPGQKTPPGAVHEDEEKFDARPDAAAAPAEEDIVRRASEPGLIGLTAVVFDRSQPVRGLGGGDFRVRVGGSGVAVEDVADASSAPVQLGFAVDVSSTMTTQLPQVRQLLSRLALRTLGDGGRLSLVTADAEARVVLEWVASPDRLARALEEVGTATEGNLASMITTSLAAFAGRLGRQVLVVVTDGGDTSTRSDWSQAAMAVDTAGVPILVIGFRDGHLEERTRRQLGAMAVASGGKSYFLRARDSDLLGMVSDHYQEMIAASYALQFRLPAGSKTSPRKVRVETVGGRLEVRHPSTVR